MGFSKDFIWGASTASYQIEGDAAGRAASVWDEFAHSPGKTSLGATGDIACDHYNRLDEDLTLMADIGLQAYRFSFSWPRLLPEGTGRIDERGLAFYDRLIDGLLAKNIQPFATLFHWDYPVALYRKGGWLNPDSPKWFAEYTQVIAERYSDRIGHWMTLNEPQCFIEFGHHTGMHAPGLQLPFDQVLLAAHHALLAHGMAVEVLRSTCKKPPVIGFAPVGVTYIPHTAADVDAARRAFGETSTLNLFSTNTWYADPVFFGHYPADGLKLFEPFLPKIGPDDMKTISAPIDFYGVNIYNGTVITERDGTAQIVEDPYAEFTAFGWPITPDALYWGPKFCYERYQKPVYITENGMAGSDIVNAAGEVRDDHRIAYTAQYLRALKRAAADGVDIRGYFHWSLMDNFEWSEGYTKRFGMVYVDYHTGKRTVKASGHWYRDVIASNGEKL